MKKILGIFFVLFSIGLYAQDPPPPDGLSGNDLRVWLKANWYDSWHSSLGYNSARQEMYSDIDNEGGKVYCVYTGFNQDAQFTTFLDPINAEHTIPQSFFNSNEPMKSDIHHLYPTHMNVNSDRGNLPFNEVIDSSTDNWYVGNASGITNTTGIPSSNIEDYSERDVNLNFEPREDHKGDVARAIFYFYTMYPTQAGTISSLGDPSVFHQWHLADLPDAKEVTRNNKTQGAQGNYNPYISMPELVSQAWGFPSGLDDVMDGLIQIYPNPSSDVLFVKGALPGASFEILDIAGRSVLRTSENSIDVKTLKIGFYLLRYEVEDFHSILPFQKQ